MSHSPRPRQPSLTIRRAATADRAAVARLAALDSQPAPAEPVLLAEVDGRVWAALSLATGRAVADPFEPSAEATALLRQRAAQLQAAEPTAGRRRLARPRWLSA